MRKTLFFILAVCSLSAMAGTSGINDLATGMGASLTTSIHTILDSLRKPFYAIELIFLVLCVKSNPKMALGGAGLVAMIYEFAVSFSTITA